MADTIGASVGITYRATGNTQDLDIFSGLVISNKKLSSNLEGSTL
jgi:hypothetical protein